MGRLTKNKKTKQKKKKHYFPWFLAFSNFYYALGNRAKLLNINMDDLDLDKFKTSTSLICSSTLDELKELNRKNNASINDKFLTNLTLKDS